MSAPTERGRKNQTQLRSLMPSGIGARIPNLQRNQPFVVSNIPKSVHLQPLKIKKTYYAMAKT